VTLLTLFSTAEHLFLYAALKALRINQDLTFISTEHGPIWEAVDENLWFMRIFLGNEY
jgi:hypothetical protein